MQYLSPFPGSKKTLILQQREEELRHALRHDESARKISKAAERLRTAKLHLFKALCAGLKDRYFGQAMPEDEWANLERQFASWESYSGEEIIEQYKVGVSHRSS